MLNAAGANKVNVIKVVRAVLPYLMWLPALFWLAPPILWLTTGWHWAAIATVVSLLTWTLVYVNERAPVHETR